MNDSCAVVLMLTLCLAADAAIIARQFLLLVIVSLLKVFFDTFAFFVNFLIFNLSIVKFFGSIFLFQITASLISPGSELVHQSIFTESIHLFCHYIFWFHLISI